MPEMRVREEAAGQQAMLELAPHWQPKQVGLEVAAAMEQEMVAQGPMHQVLMILVGPFGLTPVAAEAVLV